QGKEDLAKSGRELRDARREEKKAKAGGDKSLAKKATAALKQAEQRDEATKYRVEKGTEKKEHAAQEKQIEHLVTLIRNVRDELNDFDQEAISEVREWAEENAAIRVKAAADPRIEKALKDIKKPRNRTFLKTVIAGDADGKVGKDLEKRGFEDAEHHLEEVMAAEAVVSREKEKKDKGKGKHHTNLKATLMSMSHEAREMYLARVSHSSKESLEDPKK